MGRLACVLLCALLAVSAADFDAPIIDIDLDLPPEQRWNAAVMDVLNRHGFENSFGKVMNYVFSQVPVEVINAIEPILDDLNNGFGEYGQEIQGMATVFQQQGYGQNITVGRLVLMNLIYEISAFCTSIVAQNSNGTIYHARNLDWSFPGLPNMTYTARFMSQGQLQYYTTAFIGYVGVLTGMRPGAFSVSVDERGLSDPVTDIINNVMSALQGGKAIGFFLRDQLAAPYSDFANLINTLNTTQLIAPVYLITAGVNPGEGAVITRDRNHADDSDGVDNGVWDIDPPSAWWRLETNYDHWEPVPQNDDRRDPANALMEAIGEASINVDTLFKVLSTPPILNEQTCYTATMSAGLQMYHTTVRTH